MYFATFASLFLLSCASLCIDVIAGKCSISKHERGIGERMQCTNANLTTVQTQSSNMVSSILIFHSRIPVIPDNSFAKYVQSLESLNMNDCGILRIDENAFAGLIHLKSLGLSNNNITVLTGQTFSSLISLEQLDLSFNRIGTIDNSVFQRLTRLRRMDISENQLRCIDPQGLRVMSAIERFGFQGNPWNLHCRGQLSLWLRDHGVAYKTDPHGPESWLDGILWRCLLDDPHTSGLATNQCVFFNLFNQLRSALISATANPDIPYKQCSEGRNALIKCLNGREPWRQTPPTNGQMMRQILVQLERNARKIL